MADVCHSVSRSLLIEIRSLLHLNLVSSALKLGLLCIGVEMADVRHSVSRSLLSEIRSLLLACIRTPLWRCIGIQAADVCHSVPSVKKALFSIKRDLLTRIEGAMHWHGSGRRMPQ